MFNMVYPELFDILRVNHTETRIEHPGIVRQRVEDCSERSGMVRRGYFPI